MVASLNAVLDQLEDEGLTEDPDALFEAFTSWSAQSGRELYPHQEESLLELVAGNNVIAQTPTGSGKSLIALAAHFVSLARGGRSFYTAPLKALVSEKFFDLVDAFGADNVGMITGDVSLNPLAPIICCTAEILANQTLREGSYLDVDMVIMDEFHFYSDPQRGWAWQLPLLEIKKAQFVALSATLGNTTALAKALADSTGREVAQIGGAERPVPLEFEYCPDDLATVVERLLKEDKAPIYIVHFAQRDAVSTANSLSRLPLISKDKKTEITAALKGENFGRGFGQTLRGLLTQGIGVHHAGMLPRYRRLVERLAGRGLLAVICGTDTLGVGINVPIRTVLFTGLVKYDGQRMRHLSAREFHQIAGRAGRAGFDTVGYVRVLASEDEIESAKRRARMSAAQEASDKRKLKKLAKSSPKGGRKGDKKTTWTKSTFERLLNAEPEALRSRFDLNHAFFLNTMAGPGDAEGRLLRLATTNHDQPVASNPHVRRLGEIYRSLVTAGVIERVGSTNSHTSHGRLRAVRDLPDDFALNQPLAPFALAALDLLDPDSPDHVLDIISVVEAVLEDPMPLLMAQRRQARDQVFSAMRAEGRSYEERMAAIEETSWPRPLAELLIPTFEVFARTNPWVDNQDISPKAVVRLMVENAMTFSELISRFDLANAEGVLLRYLTDAYRALRQIPPARFQTEELEAVIDWLGTTVRAVDSSLLDEWEQLSRGEQPHPTTAAEESAFGADPDGQPTLAGNPYLLRKAIRNQMFHLVEMMSRDAVEPLANSDSSSWDVGQWDRALSRYWAEHEWMGIDQQARAADLFDLDENPDDADLLTATGSHSIEEVPATRDGSQNWWVARQIIVDPAGNNDWHLSALVDVPASRADNQVRLQVVAFTPA